jgi:hypothetical protein
MSETEIVKLREDVRDVVTLLADVMSATGGNDANDFDHVKTIGSAGSTLTAAGAVTVTQALTASSTVAVTGAMTAASTLAVTGVTTLTAALNANGGILCDTDKFTVADGTGNTAIAGTLAVTGASTLTGAVSAASLQNAIGTRRFHTFAGSLAASTAAGTAYTDNDIMVELGTLDVSVNSGIVTPTKIFIHKAVVLITTAAGQTLAGNLALGTATGEAENAAVTGAVEVVGAGVTAFSPTLSAALTITEIDINFNSVGAHVFEPNVAIAIANKYLYARATTALNADGTAGRFTVELEYTIM